MSRALRSANAASAAHSMAADEDRPAPSGTSEVSTRSAPADGVAGPLQRPDHAGKVGVPAGASGDELVLPELDGLVEVDRAEPPASVGARSRCDVGGLRQRERQDEAVVVVGVLTDQVDAARCGPDSRGSVSGERGEGSDDLCGEHAQSSSSSRRASQVASRSTAFSCSGYRSTNRVQLFGQPGEADLLLAAAVGQLLDAPVGEVHQPARARASRSDSWAVCTLTEPTDGADAAGRMMPVIFSS